MKRHFEADRDPRNQMIAPRLTTYVAVAVIILPGCAATPTDRCSGLLGSTAKLAADRPPNESQLLAILEANNIDEQIPQLEPHAIFGVQTHFKMGVFNAQFGPNRQREVCAESIHSFAKSVTAEASHEGRSTGDLLVTQGCRQMPATLEPL